MSDSVVHVWHLAPRDAGRALYVSVTTEDERARADRFRRAADATRFLAGRALVRWAVAGCIGAAPLEIVVDRGCAHCGDPRHGRPRIAWPAGAGLEFSLTRSSSTVAVALARAAVGLDAESSGSRPDGLATAEVFSDGDRALLASSGPHAVLGLWAAKEAVGKASGLGLVDAALVHCAPPAAGPAPASDARGRAWWVTGVTLPGTSVAALASATRPERILVEDAESAGLRPG